MSARAAGVGRFQFRHRRPDVDPFARPRGPREVEHHPKPFEQRGGGLPARRLPPCGFRRGSGSAPEAAGRRPRASRAPPGPRPSDGRLTAVLRPAPSGPPAPPRPRRPAGCRRPAPSARPSSRCSTSRMRPTAASLHSPASTPRRASTTPRIRLTACPAARSNPRRALSQAAANPSPGDVPGRVVFDPPQQTPERGRQRRNLHPVEIQPPQSPADLPQAPPDQPARSRRPLGRLIRPGCAARIAETVRRDLLPPQCREPAAGILEFPNRRRLEGSSSASIDSSRLSIPGCPHRSRNAARTSSGMGPRSCFRFTVGAGCVRPRRRAPTALPSLPSSSNPFPPPPKRRSTASAESTTRTASCLSIVSTPPGAASGAAVPFDKSGRPHARRCESPVTT